MFARDQLAPAFDSLEADWVEHARKQKPSDGQEYNGQWYTDYEPARETDRFAIGLLDEPGEDGVGRRADDGGDPADRGGVGHAEHQAQGEVVVGRGRQRCGFSHRLACVVSPNEINDTQRDGQHHRGGGGVRDERAQHGGYKHESANHVHRLGAHELERDQCDAPIQSPPLHRERNQEPAHEQEDVFVGVGRRGGFDARCPENRKERDWQ